MLGILDLPLYLKGNMLKNKEVKTICIVNRQIAYPKHLELLEKSESNVPVLVDIIGMEISKRSYLIKGQAVAILGPQSLRPVAFGKRLLVLNSYVNLQSENNEEYVELVNIYKNKNTGNDFLYATTTLLREEKPIYDAYPELCTFVDRLKEKDWNFNAVYSTLNLPDNYNSASEHFKFRENEKKFVFQPKADPNLRSEYSKKEVPEKKGIKKALESRASILPKPPQFVELENGVNIAESKVNKHINEMQKDLGSYLSITNAIMRSFEKMKTNWRRSPEHGVLTGRAIFKDALERKFPQYKHRYVGGLLFIDDALDNNDALKIWYSEDIPKHLANHKNSMYKEFYNDLVTYRSSIYICILDSLLVLKGRLVNTFDYSPIDNDIIFRIMQENPYYLTLLDNRLKIEDLDKLAMLFKINMQDSKVIQFRNAAYLHNYLSDSSNEIIENNTLIEYSEIDKKVVSGYIFNKYGYTCVQDFGLAVHPDKIKNLETYVLKGAEEKYFELPKNSWQQMGFGGSTKYIYKLKENSTNSKIIEDYLSSGLGVLLEFENTKYISDFDFAKKERFIINRLYELQIKGYKPSLSASDLERCIRGFERQKALEWSIPDFKLEERQIDAVQLLYNPVMCLTGPAGSGKTTTAEAMLYCLESVLGFEDEGIMFCAPTGKAANRLKEVVKKLTRTIHSLFGIGYDSFTLMDESSVKKKADISVLIIDEGSMINLDLMYNLISKIEDGTRIIFMGDREQLPPIGFGKPFTNILMYLPCVVLNVTKRASSNSGITRNAEKLIYFSDDSNPLALESCGDFRILYSTKNDVAKLVSGISYYHMGKSGPQQDNGRTLTSLGVDLTPDDIQVVTPVNNNNWGTKYLNKVLQDVFNPKTSKMKAIRIKKYTNNKDEKEFTEFREGDRVIHLENNNSSPRLILKSNNSFILCKDSMGVMNGDVGKVKGVYSDIRFEDEDGNEDENLKDRYQFLPDGSLRYLAVEYIDVDKLGNELKYIILYPFTRIDSIENDKLEREEKTIEVIGSSLNTLDLAYALTVHKLQGSQAKLIIAVMFNVPFHDSFISRNMLYTAITRASMGVYLVGDVVGYYSAVEKGRKIEQNLLCNTITDNIYK